MTWSEETSQRGTAIVLRERRESNRDPLSVGYGVVCSALSV